MEQEHIESQRISRKVFDEIVQIGKSIEPNFFISKDELEYYENLILYFTNSYKSIYDLKKGLLIGGDIGTGKTLSMKIMQKISSGFMIINTRYIVREYIQYGVSILNDYGKDCFSKLPNGNFDRKKPLTRCFDDFGLENINAKMFGNQQSVMEEIILDRYDMFLGYGMKTFATTNLNLQLLEETYGERVKDRLREMMNYITITGKSKRK